MRPYMNAQIMLSSPGLPTSVRCVQNKKELDSGGPRGSFKPKKLHKNSWNNVTSWLSVPYEVSTFLTRGTITLIQVYCSALHTEFRDAFVLISQKPETVLFPLNPQYINQEKIHEYFTGSLKTVFKNRQMLWRNLTERGRADIEKFLAKSRPEESDDAGFVGLGGLAGTQKLTEILDATTNRYRSLANWVAELMACKQFAEVYILKSKQ